MLGMLLVEFDEIFRSVDLGIVYACKILLEAGSEIGLCTSADSVSCDMEEHAYGTHFRYHLCPLQ